MFRFFKKKELSALCNGAEEYLRQTYNPYVPKFGPKYSLEIEPKVDPDTKYSLRKPTDRYSESAVKASLDSIITTGDASDALSAKLNMSFVDKLLEHISAKGLRDSAVYKAAHVDRRLFSKIASDRTYAPSKDTCIALVLALRLDIGEAKDMLSRAGYVLSHSSKRDVIIEYFLKESVHDLYTVNEILYQLEEKPLGR